MAALAAEGPAITMSFANNFWGKDDAGVGPLLQRMHAAKQTCDELKSFYSARASLEDEYARKLLSLSRKPLGSQEMGSLRVSLDTVRGEVEAMGRQHQSIAVQLKSELEEPLAAFAGAMKERRKIVQNGIEKLLKTKIQQTQHVNKTRDRYEQECLKIKGYLAQGHMVMGQEERKNKAKLEKTQISVATTNTEYENAIKILEDTTVRWNREWKAAADKFQDLEEERLDFTKSSLWQFANIASTVCVSDDASCEKIRLSLEKMDVEGDIAAFIKEKGTGQEIPDPPKYINFCRGDVADSQSETSEDDNYSVAQFPRSINPAFRSSSPQPSTYESHHDPNSSLARDLGHRGTQHPGQEQPRPINPAYRSSSPQPSTYESHHDPNSSLARELGHKEPQQPGREARSTHSGFNSSSPHSSPYAPYRDPNSIRGRDFGQREAQPFSRDPKNINPAFESSSAHPSTYESHRDSNYRLTRDLGHRETQRPVQEATLAPRIIQQAAVAQREAHRPNQDANIAPRMMSHPTVNQQEAYPSSRDASLAPRMIPQSAASHWQTRQSSREANFAPRTMQQPAFSQGESLQSNRDATLAPRTIPQPATSHWQAEQSNRDASLAPRIRQPTISQGESLQSSRDAAIAPRMPQIETGQREATGVNRDTSLTPRTMPQPTISQMETQQPNREASLAPKIIQPTISHDETQQSNREASLAPRIIQPTINQGETPQPNGEATPAPKRPQTATSQREAPDVNGDTSLASRNTPQPEIGRQSHADVPQHLTQRRQAQQPTPIIPPASSLAQIPHDPYPLDGMTMLCRTGPPSERSSQTTPSARPSSRDSHSDYSNPTSMSSQELPSGKASPVKQDKEEQPAEPVQERRVLKKKSGLFQKHSLFRKKSFKGSSDSRSNRNTWHAPPTAGQSTPAKRPPLFSQQTSSSTSNRATPSPEPIEANATLALNIGQNVFPVSNPDTERKEETNSPGDTEETDPIALALAELKGVATGKQAAGRVSADRYHGIATPAPSSRGSEQVARSVASALGNNSPAGAGRRRTPPPLYDSQVQSSPAQSSPAQSSPAQNSQPQRSQPQRSQPQRSQTQSSQVQRLGVPPQAVTARAMKETSQKFADQTRDMFGSGSPAGSTAQHPSSSASRSGTRGSELPRAVSPAPARSVSPRPAPREDTWNSHRSASPNPRAGTQRSPRASYERPSRQSFVRQSPASDMARVPSPSPYNDYGRVDGGVNAADMAIQLAPIGDDLYGSQRGRVGSRPGTSMSNRAMGLYDGGIPAQTGSRQRSKSVADPSRQYTSDGRPILHFARAMYMYQAAIPEELGFAKGDVLAVLRHQDDGWWEAEVQGGDGRIGLVPSNYLQPW